VAEAPNLNECHRQNWKYRRNRAWDTQGPIAARTGAAGGDIMSNTFRRTIAMAIVVAIALIGAALATGACSSERTASEQVGSSSSAVSSVAVVSDGGAGLHNASTAAGHADASGSAGTDQLTVWQGKSGSTYENFFGQRFESDALNVFPATGTWPAPSSMADGNTFLNYNGVARVAYLNEPGKFVFASAASSQGMNGGAGNTSVDVILVTTTNGGQIWSSGTQAVSVLCTFYPQGSSLVGCPGSSQDGLFIESIALAVDPNPSTFNTGTNEYHDVWLWFTTSNSASNSRVGYFYEFWVTSNGTVQQLAYGSTGGIVNAGTVPTSWPSIQGSVCPSSTCDANADTVTMVVGKEKACINANTPFLFATWASYNPLLDTACSPSQTTTVNMTWSGVQIINPETVAADITETSNLFGSTVGKNEPDCFGYQVNWPAVALAYDDTPTDPQPGGGGSVTMAISVPNPADGGIGNLIATYTTSPIGCTGGAGMNCYNCCQTGGAWGCGPSSAPATSPPICHTSSSGAVDCTSSGCNGGNGPGGSCPALPGADQILPALAFQANADAGVPAPNLSLAWYDNRNGADAGANTPLIFGSIRAQSAGGATGEFPQDFPSTTTQVVSQSTEGTGSQVAPVNTCIGLAVQNESSHWYGANNGDASIYNWQYVN
jgi:hypothetical protein